MILITRYIIFLFVRLNFAFLLVWGQFHFLNFVIFVLNFFILFITEQLDFCFFLCFLLNLRSFIWRYFPISEFLYCKAEFLFDRPESLYFFDWWCFCFILFLLLKECGHSSGFCKDDRHFIKFRHFFVFLIINFLLIPNFFLNLNVKFLLFLKLNFPIKIIDRLNLFFQAERIYIILTNFCFIIRTKKVLFELINWKLRILY